MALSDNTSSRYNLSESDDITLTGSARTVTIGELLPFTFYEFTVVAFTIETGPGASDIVRTGEAAPTAPTNVIATAINSTHVTVKKQLQLPQLMS
jgi:hypothetical protein